MGVSHPIINQTYHQGERSDQGRPEAVVRVQGAGPDLRQGQGQHDRLPLRQVKGIRHQDVLRFGLVFICGSISMTDLSTRKPVHRLLKWVVIGSVTPQTLSHCQHLHILSLFS